MQLKGQLRELIAIMHMWRDKGTPNHLLVNNILYFTKEHFFKYVMIYDQAYFERFKKRINVKYLKEFMEFCEVTDTMIELYRHQNKEIYPGWHGREYLRVCMANLYEKYKFGIGKNKICCSDWQRLCEGYFYNTGEEFRI
jgi:hypothetical protein